MLLKRMLFAFMKTTGHTKGTGEEKVRMGGSFIFAH